jgi:hypothetical protein
MKAASATEWTNPMDVTDVTDVMVVMDVVAS